MTKNRNKLTCNNKFLVEFPAQVVLRNIQFGADIFDLPKKALPPENTRLCVSREDAKKPFAVLARRALVSGGTLEGELKATLRLGGELFIKGIKLKRGEHVVFEVLKPYLVVWPYEFMPFNHSQMLTLSKTAYAHPSLFWVSSPRDYLMIMHCRIEKVLS